jgi:diacylglycerol kinase (ATP)
VKVKIIVNPYANRWRAQKRIPAIETSFITVGLPYDLIRIPEAGGGKQEAMKAVDEGYDAVVAAGGDGTVSEVVNGLIERAGDKATLPLGVLPVGTGNDFNAMARLPNDLLASAQIIADGQTRQVDAGRITMDGAVHYFDNNCALAMEPMVTIENLQMTRLRGNLRYVIALIRALMKLKAWHMSVSWEGGGYEGPLYLMSVCNSPRTGGIFKMAPEARMDDGLLDYVVAPDVSKLTVISLLPRLIAGTHIHHPKVTFGKSSWLKAESEPGTPIHADGEVLGASFKKISYETLPGKITLLSPSDNGSGPLVNNK